MVHEELKEIAKMGWIQFFSESGGLGGTESFLLGDNWDWYIDALDMPLHKGQRHFHCHNSLETTGIPEAGLEPQLAYKNKQTK